MGNVINKISKLESYYCRIYLLCGVTLGLLWDHTRVTEGQGYSSIKRVYMHNQQITAVLTSKHIRHAELVSHSLTE